MWPLENYLTTASLLYYPGLRILLTAEPSLEIVITHQIQAVQPYLIF